MKGNRLICILVSVLILLIFLLSGCNMSSKKEPVSRTEFMMDTVCTISLYDKTDTKILDEVFNRLYEIEKRMSNTVSDSDINILNRNAGIKPVSVHDDVYYVLEKTKYYAELTSGAYDPTIGPLVDLWDIKNQLEKEDYEIPKEKDIQDALKKVDYNNIELLDNNEIYLKEKGMKLDLGGIVKGYAADEVKKILLNKGVKSAIVDLGGNIYAVGEKPVNEKWKIGIQNPFDNMGSYVGIVKLRDKSVVTSGDYERYFELNGVRYHHIIDSNTGYPTNNELSGVSIISDSSIDGDALSTAFFVLGIDRSIELLKNMKEVDAVFIAKDGNIYVTPGLKDYFTIKNNKFNLIIKDLK
jgi:thiamine biosynthesis lipoprotein